MGRLVVVLLFAAVLRLAGAAWVQRLVDREPGRLCLIAGDADGYWKLAHQIASGGEYSVYDPPRRCLRMPGFPALLASSLVLLGDSVWSARVVLSLVGTGVVGLTYWFVLKETDSTTALIAAGLAAVSPMGVLFSSLLLSEMLFAATLLASLIGIAAVTRNECRPSHTPTTEASFKPSTAVSWFAVGVLIGAATLVRPTWLLVSPATAVLAVVFSPATLRRVRFASGICLLAGTAITLAPWTARNLAVTGRIVPTTLWFGASLYDGLNPDADGGSNMAFIERDGVLKTMSEYDADQHYRKAAIEWAAANPGRALQLTFNKLLNYWSPWPERDQGAGSVARWGVAAFNIALFGLAIVGIVLGDRSPRRLLLAAGPVLYFAAVHAVFVGSWRYRLPAEFPLMLLAADGAVRLWGRWVGSTRIAAEGAVVSSSPRTGGTPPC
jgi:4-amino-4-deoxy-L-arabinose transferase-like glycosyltransferase